MSLMAWFGAGLRGPGLRANRLVCRSVGLSVCRSVGQRVLRCWTVGCRVAGSRADDFWRKNPESNPRSGLRKPRPDHRVSGPSFNYARRHEAEALFCELSDRCLSSRFGEPSASAASWGIVGPPLQDAECGVESRRAYICRAGMVARRMGPRGRGPRALRALSVRPTKLGYATFLTRKDSVAL